ncbi:MAG: LysE family translocator, partial [Pseudomonadota bacterium]
LIPVALAFFIVTVSPGPANLAVATVAMRQGRRAGQVFGLGLSLGLAFWGIIAATGMGAVLQASADALFILKVLGGLYLLWLAFQSARSAIQPKASDTTRIKSGRRFWQGLLLNLSNPKAVVAWMAALSVGLNADGATAEIAILTGICIAIGFANYAGYAAAFSLSGVMSGYRRVARWVEGTVAVLFAAAGLGLLRSAFTR